MKHLYGNNRHNDARVYQICKRYCVYFGNFATNPIETGINFVKLSKILQYSLISVLNL